MKIVFVAAEMAPFAKVGGLGEIVGGLSESLVKIGYNVEVILPKYSFINFETHKAKFINFQSFEKGLWQNTGAISILHNNVKVTFISPNSEIDYFTRPNIYGYDDDISRFLYFSRATLDYLMHIKKDIDILHIHDWHTSICPVLYKDHFSKMGLKIKKIVLNIHNLKYQGITSYKDLKNTGLDGKKYLSSLKLKDNHLFSKKINLLKGGIVYSDAVVAVSPTYAEEILTKAYGCNLEKTLKKARYKLHGILNGIDTTVWNPSTDPYIKDHYNKDLSIDEIIEKKKLNKKRLQQKLGLLECNKPIISNIGRLVPQKAPDLIEKSMFFTLQFKGQFVLLGSSMIEKIQNRFNQLNKDNQDNANLALTLSYDEELSHLIFAASDFVIVPSIFEPCGLTQIFAMRYGTIPIVRHTGGLADTVYDIDNIENEEKVKNGFVFEKPSYKEIEKTIKRALEYYFFDKNKIRFLMKNCINIDHSLINTAKKYAVLYQKLVTFQP